MEVYLITGANRGIGLALTRVVLTSGKSVIAGARRPDSAAELRKLAEEYPDTMDLIACDLLDERALHVEAAKIGRKHNKVDVIVNNGAIMPDHGDESILEMDLSLFSKAFDTNVLGQIRMIRAFYSLLVASKRPRIVNVSSGLGSIADRQGYDYYSYATSKAALNMVTRSVAFELGSRGVTTVAISPGWVHTDMGGENAPLSPQQSAESSSVAIDKLQPAQNGLFLNRTGVVGEYVW